MSLTKRRIAGAAVWIGGRGEVLLLVHGAWGGSELHWSPVWDALAERFTVVAPELPGIGDDGPGLPSFDAYAEWLAALVDALEAEAVWCAGNSFGAAVVWQLAARLGRRCRGVVLVNGVPPPRLPSLVRASTALPPLRRAWRALFRRMNFAPSVLRRAFADPTRAPPALVRALATPPPARLALLFELLVRGAAATATPTAPVLVAWGAADRLAGTDGARAARKLQRAIPGAALALLPSAGHCPQLEQPAAFVDTLVSFAASCSNPRDAGDDGPRRRRALF